MSLKVGEVFAELKLDNRGFDQGLSQGHRGLQNVEQQSGRTEGALGRLGGSFRRVGEIAAGFVVGKAITELPRLIGSATSSVIAFGSKMNEAYTLMPGMSERAMGAMSADVKQFAQDMGVLPNDVVPALYQSISAGVPADNVFTFLETAQKAAVGGVTELTTAVDGISSVVNAYGQDVIDAASASDLMFTAVKLGKTDFDQLSRSLFQVIPTAAALGVEFGDVTAGLAALTAQGVPTSVATTQMRQMFVELSKEGTATSDVFKELAGVSFKEFIAAGGNTADALKLLEDHAQKSGLGINDLFGSVEAGAAALALTGPGYATFTRNIDEMGNSAGATDEAFQTMEAGIDRTLARIRSTLAVLGLEIGSRVIPAIEPFVNWFADRLPGAIDAAMWSLDNMIGTAGAFRGWVSSIHDEGRPQMTALNLH